MDNNEIIKNFYSAFTKGDANTMISFYSDNVVFTDPAFGTLKGKKAKAMWKMLLSNKKSLANVSFNSIKETNNTNVSAKWTATYNYGPKSRKVVNNVSAEFEFKDDKIIKHTDNFNLWNWSKQALGTSGYLLGWSNFMKNKIQEGANQKLNNFLKDI